MNAKQMVDMGYTKDGDLWISPTTGEVLSFQQACQEAECRREELIDEIVDMADGGPTNGSH
jgi:hypothetical protein